MRDPAPFARVYTTLARDHPRVWRDLALLGAYVRALTEAEGMYPAPFEVPRIVTDEQVAALVDDGVLDPVAEDQYAFHGLDRERSGRTSRGRAGGLARARAGHRSVAGRFAGGTLVRDAGHSRSNAGDDAGDDAGSPALVNGAGDRPASSSVEPANAGDVAGSLVTSVASETDRRDSATTSRAVSDSGYTPRARARSTSDAREVSPDPAGVGVARSEVGGGRYGTPDVPTCTSPDAHGSDWRYYVGVGWRCLACDAESPGEPSFREKARDAGATL
jgi:hypothetical protein